VSALPARPDRAPMAADSIPRGGVVEVKRQTSRAATGRRGRRCPRPCEVRQDVVHDTVQLLDRRSCRLSWRLSARVAVSSIVLDRNHEVLRTGDGVWNPRRQGRGDHRGEQGHQGR
jgi:hypothetical protein